MLDAACVLSAAALEEARSGWGMEDDAPAALAGARRAQAELGGESAALALVLASGAVAGEQVQAAGGASACSFWPWPGPLRRRPAAEPLQIPGGSYRNPVEHCRNRAGQ